MIRFIPTPESVRNLDDFLDRLEHIPQRMADRDEPIRAAIRQGFALNFERESAGNGPRWAPLAEMTQNERQRLGFGREHPILVRTGGYKASFIDDGAADHIAEREVTETALLIDEGSDDYRVSHLEFGWVNIPPRPVLGLSFVAEDAIGDEIDAILDRLLE
jgi:phage gpG-like protein